MRKFQENQFNDVRKSWLGNEETDVIMAVSLLQRVGVIIIFVMRYKMTGLSALGIYVAGGAE